MSKQAPKTLNNAFKQDKQLRRRWITFTRMVRYGVNNFSRNAWLTTAATAVMTITLMIILSSFLAHNMFSDTISALRKRVDISIYLKSDVATKDVQTMRAKLEKLSNVAAVRFVSADEAQRQYNEQNSDDTQQLKDLADILRDTGSLLPASFRIQVRDLAKLGDIKALVDHDKLFLANRNPVVATNYGGDKQTAIDNIARTAVFAERAGMIASVIFVVISIMIIFNTIRMAIFNRREEIEMMRLVGADKAFIRGPFVVEAIMYGFIAALISVALAYFAVVVSQGKMAEYGINTAPTVDLLQNFPGLILLATIVIGGLLGIVSSQLAVRRYLKV